MLTRHFARRLFASEQEQESASLGFGIGAVLALIAAPGAFASVLLIDKYSTLLAWLRGQHMNGIPQLPSDEYFFVVLSMTITGLVMTVRWNRLFPDRRDFSNLAVLPLPPSYFLCKSHRAACSRPAAVRGCQRRLGDYLSLIRHH